MRFRLRRRGKGVRSALPAPPPKPAAAPAPPRASDLGNPYGRVFGQARKREDLRK